MKWLRRLAMSYFLFPLLIVLSILLMVGGGVNGAQSNDTIDQVSTLNVQVENYRATVKEIAAEYGMEEYVDLILAIMQIESGGNGNDPMQTSESKFNTRYPHTPGPYWILCIRSNVGSRSSRSVWIWQGSKILRIWKQSK